MNETLHRVQLDRLGRDVGEQSAWHFADRYLQMLPERLRRINGALDRDDRDELWVATVALRSSSSMVGAWAIGRLCARVIDNLRTDDLAELRARAAELSVVAEQTAAVLGPHLSELRR